MVIKKNLKQNGSARCGTTLPVLKIVHRTIIALPSGVLHLSILTEVCEAQLYASACLPHSTESLHSTAKAFMFCLIKPPSLCFVIHVSGLHPQSRSTKMVVVKATPLMWLHLSLSHLKNMQTTAISICTKYGSSKACDPQCSIAKA